MKKLLQQVFISGFSLYVTSFIFSGLKISGGLETIVVGGVLLTLGLTIIKPLIDIITLPFKLATLGIFSFLTNTLIIYMITLVYPKIKIDAFKFQGVSLYGFEIKPLFVSTLFAFLLISVTIYLISRLIAWVFSR